MSGLVVAFGGGMSSGKSTLSARVAQAIGWPRVSFGDYVRTIARERGLGEDREALQNMGESLISEGWEKFCRGVLSQALWSPGQSLVVDGVRHKEAVTSLRRLVGPARLVLVYVAVARAVQDERLRDIGLRDSERRRKILSHSTEVQAHTALPKMADFTVNGEQGVEEATQGVLQWLGRLGVTLPPDRGSSTPHQD